MENNISRGKFLKVGAGTALSLVTPFNILSSSFRKGTAIEKITALPVQGEFYRPIAMNAYDRGPKGIGGRTSILRVVLDDGTEGIGILGYRRINDDKIEKIKQLIGITPAEIYQWEGEQIVGFADKFRPLLTDPNFAFIESPILDAVGKIKEKPVWQLFGSKVRNAVDCYDGTLYFKDIELDTGVTVLADLAKRIKDDGYKAIKMKVGRPSKWMKGEAGVKRDIEAFVAVREAVGNNFNLMADANNGYKDQFDWAIQFLSECLPHDMYWIEELFPDSVEQYQQLHSVLNEKNLKVRIAEGESMPDIEEFEPFLDKNIYNVIQPDMRTAGFTNILRASERAKQFQISVVPHNWQSEMGKLMSIHAAMIDRNITFAEDDRYDNFGVDSSGYLFRDGQWIPPEESGWGIQLTDHYDYFKEKNEDLVIS